MQRTSPPLVDGRPWPLISTEGVVWLPPGAHVLEDGGSAPALRIERFNCDIRAAALLGSRIEMSYRSQARALVTLNIRPVRIEVDGEEYQPQWFGERTLVLPRGQHVVTFQP